MPRLGTGDAPGSGGGGTPRRPAASAYPRVGRGGFLSNVVFLVFFTFILRNLFFRDYRLEEIEQLRASGKTQEEIDKLVPKTAKERRAFMRNKRSEYDGLVSDVARLKVQVKELQDLVLSDDARGEHATENEDTDQTKGDSAADEGEAATDSGAKTTHKKEDSHDHHSTHHHDHKSKKGVTTSEVDKERHVKKSHADSKKVHKKKKTVVAKPETEKKKVASIKKRTTKTVVTT